MSDARTLRIERAGALTTVQDLGRPGLAHLGVPRSGAADRDAHAHANALVGNDAHAAALETTATGCAVRMGADAVVAVTGADSPVWVGHVPAPMGAPIRVAAGQLVEVGMARSGLRCTVAINGGIAVEPVLGSRSTDVLSGLGPAPLREGDVVPLGPGDAIDDARFAQLRQLARGERGHGRTGTLEIAVHAGPRLDWFVEEALEHLAADHYTVTPDSNRVGIRLAGAALAHRGETQLPSEGMVLGAVQVPPSGQPVVFLADHPTTGGYPVIAVATPDAVASAAQAAPGDAVRFRVL